MLGLPPPLPPPLITPHVVARQAGTTGTTTLRGTRRVSRGGRGRRMTPTGGATTPTTMWRGRGSNPHSRALRLLRLPCLTPPARRSLHRRRRAAGLGRECVDQLVGQLQLPRLLLGQRLAVRGLHGAARGQARRLAAALGLPVLGLQKQARLRRELPRLGVRGAAAVVLRPPQLHRRGARGLLWRKV